MGALKKLAGDTAIYGISSILGRLINYLLVPLYTRIFVPPLYQESEYGILTTIMGYVAVTLALLTFGMETGFFRFASQNNQKETTYSSILWVLLAISGVFLVCVHGFISPLSVQLHVGDRPYLLSLLAWTLAIDAFSSIPFARLRLENKALKFATIKFSNILINVAFNLFFLCICPWFSKEYPESFIASLYTTEIGVGYVFFSYLLASVFTLLMLWKELFKFKFLFNQQLFKKILNYSFPILLVSLASILLLNIDKILLPELLKEDALVQTGIYGASFKLAVIMTLFTQAYRYAFEPFIFSEGRDTASKETYAKALKYFLLFGLLGFLVIVFYLDIIQLLLGPQLRGGLEIVPLILLANLFLGVYYSLSLWYKLTDKTQYAAYMSIGGVAVAFVLNITLVPVFGMIASAYAFFASTLLMVIASYYLGQKHFPVPYQLKSLLIYFFFAIGLYALSHFLRPDQLYFRLLLNTLLLLIFIAFIEWKERILSTIFYFLRKK